MGVFTRKYQEKVDSIVTECFVYAPSDLSGGEEVKRVKFDSDEYDVVIGMDVICHGDLAITNKDDKTTFSFRIPSETEIDFSK